MAKQTLGRGSSANDGTGDNLRDGANKINLNFNEIYTAIGDGSTVDGTWKLQDDSSTEAIISANGEVLRILGGTAVTTTISGNDLTIALDTSAVVTATGSTTLTLKPSSLVVPTAPIFNKGIINYPILAIHLMVFHKQDFLPFLCLQIYTKFQVPLCRLHL